MGFGLVGLFKCIATIHHIHHYSWSYSLTIRVASIAVILSWIAWMLTLAVDMLAIYTIQYNFIQYHQWIAILMPHIHSCIPSFLCIHFHVLVLSFLYARPPNSENPTINHPPKVQLIIFNSPHLIQTQTTAPSKKKSTNQIPHTWPDLTRREKRWSSTSPTHHPSHHSSAAASSRPRSRAMWFSRRRSWPCWGVGGVGLRYSLFHYSLIP